MKGWLWLLGGSIACGDCAVAPELGTKRQPTQTSVWYLDADGDGFGDPAMEQLAAAQPPRHVSNRGDCDDADPDTWPNAPEVRDDGIDQDCNGSDATCDTLPVYPGDLVLDPLNLHKGVRDICGEFGGVGGVVTLERTHVTSLEPLGCLCSLGGIELILNQDLVDATWLDDMVLDGNPSRVALVGSPKLTRLSVHVNGAVDELIVRSNLALTDLSITGLTHADVVQLQSLPSLTQLGPLYDLQSVGDMDLVALPDVHAWQADQLFSSLRSIETLSITQVPLDSLAPFRGVETIADLTLHSVPVTTLDGLESLTDLRDLTLRYIALSDLGRLTGLAPLDSLFVLGEPSIRTVAGMHGVTDMQRLELRNTELFLLDELATLERIDGDLHIVGNHDLHTLRGLRNLEEITGDLVLSLNHNLYDVTALHGVRVGGTVIVNNNPLLTASSLADLLAALAANQGSPAPVP